MANPDKLTRRDFFGQFLPGRSASGGLAAAGADQVSLEEPEDDPYLESVDRDTYEKRMLEVQKTIELWTKIGAISAVASVGLAGAERAVEVLSNLPQKQTNQTEPQHPQPAFHEGPLHKLLRAPARRKAIRLRGRLHATLAGCTYQRHKSCSRLWGCKNKTATLKATLDVTHSLQISIAKVIVETRKAYRIRFVPWFSFPGQYSERAVLTQVELRDNVVQIEDAIEVCDWEIMRIRLYAYDVLGNLLIYKSREISGVGPHE